MTKTLEQIADEAIVAQPGLHFNGDMDYEEWLEETGLDDSFVGDGLKNPGTEDLYDAARRLYLGNCDVSPPHLDNHSLYGIYSIHGISSRIHR